MEEAFLIISVLGKNQDLGYWYLCFFKHRSGGSSRVGIYCKIDQTVFQNLSLHFLFPFLPPFQSTSSQTQCLVFSLLIKVYLRKIFNQSLMPEGSFLFRCSLSKEWLYHQPMEGEQSQLKKVQAARRHIFEEPTWSLPSASENTVLDVTIYSDGTD